METYTETKPAEVFFTDVTLRDGQQQRTDTVTIEQRLEVFKEIRSSGVDRIEIGHLGNGNGDQQLAREIVKLIASEAKGSAPDVKLQVLFGSQEEIIQDGIKVLEEAYQEAYGDDWRPKMADQVVVHVYDRVDENLRSTSTTYYSTEESAERVCRAAKYAVNAGFMHFSISGEAATAANPSEAIQFYSYINNFLNSNGAQTVNNNLANTYGYSTGYKWNFSSLKAFNEAVKNGHNNITTSIHAHNDVNGAIDFSMQSIAAGFDRVESTHIGMGERVGNVAAVDVMTRMLEKARESVDMQQDPNYEVYPNDRARMIRFGEGIINSLVLWFDIGESLSKTFGRHAKYRWERTTLGNPYIFDNGSGPHDQALAAAITNPVDNPPYKNYEWIITLAAMMGRPLADELAIGDPVAVDKVTVGNHAGGGKTKAIKEGTLQRATPEVVAQAQEIFEQYKKDIAQTAMQGFVVSV